MSAFRQFLALTGSSSHFTLFRLADARRAPNPILGWCAPSLGLNLATMSPIDLLLTSLFEPGHYGAWWLVTPPALHAQWMSQPQPRAGFPAIYVDRSHGWLFAYDDLAAWLSPPS